MLSDNDNLGNSLMIEIQKDFPELLEEEKPKIKKSKKNKNKVNISMVQDQDINEVYGNSD